MSFSHCDKALRSGNNDKQTIPPKISVSVDVENINNACKEYVAQENDVSYSRISPKLTEERTRANLESLKHEILSLTQSLKQLNNNNSAKTSPTAGSDASRSSRNLRSLLQSS